MTDPAPSSPGEVARKKYRKGMKDLGRSLLVLAALQAVLGGALFALTREPIVLGLLAILAGAHVVMGGLLLLGHGWVNYLVAVWGCLLVGSVLLQIASPAPEGRRPTTIGPCIGLVIAVALVYYSIQNLSAKAGVRGRRESRRRR